MKSFRATLNLFPVSFPMRANLVAQESRWLRLWSKLNIGQQDDNYSAWQLHDGPIFANGPAHLGHGFNRIIKDIWVRHHYGRGRPAAVRVGWDTHGWPVENAVYKNHPELNLRANPVLLRKLAGHYVSEQIGRQRKVFAQLGLLTNWANHYQTNDWDYERQELAIFEHLLRRQLFYRSMQPTLWCCASQQVMPEIGVHYRSVATDHAFVLFLVKNPVRYQLPPGVMVLIWTTTLWTLPANQLVAINAELDYVVAMVQNQPIIVARSLLASVSAQCGWSQTKILASVSPKILVQLTLQPPFGDDLVRVVDSSHVASTTGSGCVHIAGAFGREDYQLVVTAGLTPKLIINGDGRYNERVPWRPLVGVAYHQATTMIVDYLRTHHRLIFVGRMMHDAPFDARTQKPLIYLATWQWFLRLTPLKQQLAVLCFKSDWTPGWAKQHLHRMLTQRDDWCVSRQRPWGVPLLEFFDEHGESRLTPELVRFAISQFQRLRSCDSWWTNPCDDFLPPAYRGRGWRKGNNVLDVWFDSGCSFAANARTPATNRQFGRLAAAAEGKDQFRGWFNTTLIISGLLRGQWPFKHVLVHGFVTDHKGDKLSKSKGNGLTLAQFIAQHGVDVWRLLVANAELTVDLHCTPMHLAEVKTQYRKIRNTFRFMLAHLGDYRHSRHRQHELAAIDRFMLAKLKVLRAATEQLINQWQYGKLMQQIMVFVTVQLSGFYFEAVKQTLYADATNSQRRRQIQTTLFYLTIGFLSVIKSILVFTSEEIYQHLPAFNGKRLSVHQIRSFKWRWPVMSRHEQADWEQILALKLDLNLALDQARAQQLIADHYQACVTLWLKKPLQTKVSPATLADIFRVGLVKMADFDASFQQYNNSCIKISPIANRQKCARCWRFWPTLTKDGICHRCYHIVRLHKNYYQ